MNLRQQAELDLSFILEDSANGFGWDIILTDPAGATYSMVGSSGDISQVVDPDTGILVSGRSAKVTLRISSLTAAGAGLPEGVSNASQKPWLVQFLDINGSSHTFKVSSSNPDRTLGIVSCALENYQ